MPLRSSQHVVVTADETKISFFDTGGKGEPVLFLHGLAGSAMEFFASAAAIPDRRSILVDFRGHGRSTRRPANVSRDAFIADVVQVIEAVGGPVSVVGQSMGGHTAMLVAAYRPDLVSRLLLLESGAGSGDERQHQELGKYFSSWPLPFVSRESAREFLGTGPLQQAWVADLEQREDGLHPRFDADIMVKVIREVAQPRWQEWESIACPTTVVFGAQGMFGEDERAVFMSRAHSARRVDLPNTGHDAHLESPEAWHAELRSFLK